MGDREVKYNFQSILKISKILLFQLFDGALVFYGLLGVRYN